MTGQTTTAAGSEEPAPREPTAVPPPESAPAPIAALTPAPAPAPTMAPPPVPAPPPLLTPPPPAIAPRPARSGSARRVLRVIAPWAATAAVFAVFAVSAGYAVTLPERTDLPGLATESDGRWDYPRLMLPALPAGSPRPFDRENPGQIHHADLRKLLLPAPRGARADKELPGGVDGSWVETDNFVDIFEDEERHDLRQQLVDDAVRHIAATGWVMPDGTSTRIFLLQFNTGAVADNFYHTHFGAFEPTDRARITHVSEMETDFAWPDRLWDGNVSAYVYDETEPYGDVQIRQAHILAGDTLAVITQSGPDGQVAGVPFRQTVALQTQLLG